MAHKPGWKDLGLREDWLAQVQEDVIDPDRVIVDPHHHLFRNDAFAYELDELWGDTQSGHNIVQTVFVECSAYYDMTAPEGFQPVAETAKVAQIAMEAEAHPKRAQIAGIVARADLTAPHLGDILDAHEAAGGPRFCGIRMAGACDPHPEVLMIPGRAPAGLYADPAFREGLAYLGTRGLTYDTWHYHHQNRDFCELAAAVPETTLILDHFGTPLGVGRFEGQRDSIFAQWKDDVAAIAENPNVIAKLGGLAMPDNGWGWMSRDMPPSSDELVEAQGAWYHHMIDCFGPERCMFESNFPVDRLSVGYRVLWNALKKIGAEYHEAAQEAMFSGTARRVYRLPE